VQILEVLAIAFLNVIVLLSAVSKFSIPFEFHKQYPEIIYLFAWFAVSFDREAEKANRHRQEAATNPQTQTASSPRTNLGPKLFANSKPN